MPVLPGEQKTVAEQKMLLRQLATERRSSVRRDEALARSKQIRERVLALPEVKSARVVSCYCSFGSEVETHGLIEALAKEGKTVCLPRVDDSQSFMTMYAFKSLADLKVNSFGFPEPVPESHRKVEAHAIDVILAPGLAFDEQCHRLGFGMAYYDRYISNMPRRVPVIALAFECQLFQEVPVNRRDVIVDKVVTEKRVIERKG